MTADEARDAIIQHLERMDRAECIFVFNKGGYLGNSVVMEIGYAYAHRKPVYAPGPHSRSIPEAPGQCRREH